MPWSCAITATLRSSSHRGFDEPENRSPALCRSKSGSSGSRAAAVHVCHVNGAVGREFRREDRSDAPAVRRPRRSAVCAVGVGDATSAPALGRHHPEVAAAVSLGCAMPRRDERQLPAVGRPRGTDRGVSPARQLPGLRPFLERVDHEDLLWPVVREPFAVQLVGQTVDPPRGTRVLRVGGWWLRPRARGEGDAATVRRPCRSARAVRQIRHPSRLAAVDRDHVELRPLALVAPGQEGEVTDHRATRLARCRCLRRR